MKLNFKFLLVCLIFTNLIIQADFLKQDKIWQKNQYAIGYNVPPLVHLQEKNNKHHDISFDLSFLYYYAGQDGLDLANSAAVITSGASAGNVISTDNSITLVQNLTYNPGFKAGVAISCEEWILNAKYTWIRQSTFTNESAITPDPLVGSGVWILNNWFQQLSSFGQTISATNLESQWDLGMDFADITMGYPSYEKRYLSIVPFFGVRSLWISQNLDIAIDIPSDTQIDLITSPISSYNNSKSWAFGPRTGFDVSWLFPYGLRIEGTAGANLLFTQFTNVTHTEQLASAENSQISSQLPHINCLRPEFDLGLGLGWGSYLKNENYYVDLSIRYDFLFFWQQNMMKKLTDQIITGVGAAAGDLYLHGLTLQAAFYF